MNEFDDDRLPPRAPGPRKAKENKTRTGLDSTEESTFRPNPTPSGMTQSRSTTGRKKESPREPGDDPAWWERIVFGRAGSGQLSLFCRQFAAYLSAGVDISKTLSSLENQFARTALGPVITRLRAGVKKGESIAELAAREPRTFDALFVSMIKVAEARGGIPETLKILAKHYEARQSLIRQARSALIYPVIVLLFASCVVALMTIWILPMFASLLKDIAGHGGGELPLPSRILLAFSDFVQKAGWFLIPATMILTPIVLFQLYKTHAGKSVMDRLMLRVPVFGPLLSKIDTTRFARTLSALLDAGVDVGSSLDLTSEVLRTEPFRLAVRGLRTSVMEGEALSEALAETRRFGPDVIAVIESGEETGKLPETLNHLADDYEEQVAHTVKNLGQLVQPLLMIMLGGLVLFIILAVLLPYISILTSLTR